ncbi:phage holin family protein [Paenibacillus sp. WQ 127069]|uniref:Phage holin family protein n=1 Tax=Paenibacillus baimaensis TaxID=2982185 RepID=A0ABT2UTI8_9BACL|nr:phage holin family protein [Paenibacillus sp. WQ 127069]MCU6797986.1 phage holin family protein [Paenibacillus sp. WQ 127069]
MEWNAIAQLIDPQLFLVLAACWIIGYALKQSAKVPNWTVIIFVTIFAVIFSLLILGPSPQSVLQGILIGAVAVYGYEVYKAVKQASKGDEKQ